MTDIAINPVARRAQFTGNTGTGPFAFTFNILADADIAVYKNTTLLTLTTDYTISTNANGTGSVTLTGSNNGTALVASDVLTIIGGRNLSRTTDFVTAGDLLASSLNEQLDSIVVMAQQLDEKLTRSVKVNPGDVFTDLELPLKDARKGTVLGFNATSGDPEPGPTIADTQALAAITADIATLADIEDGTDATDAIQTAASNSSNISTVAGVSGNVTTVAGIASNVTSVAGNATNINTVAGSISNVNTTASNISSVNTNATNISAIQGASANASTATTKASEAATSATNAANSATAAAASAAAAAASADTFDDTYLGSKSSDPSTDNDGDALNAGDLYFNTSSNTLKVYSGSAWQDAAIDSSGFAQTTGDTMTGNLSFGDNVKATFGNSDLEIFHDGSHSYLYETGTGEFRIKTNGNIIQFLDNSNNYLIKAAVGAEVGLYFNTAQKLVTTNTGCDISGTLTSDGLTVDKGSAGTLATFTDGVNSNFVIETASLITTVGNTGGSSALAFKSNSTEQMRIDSSGNVGIGTSSPSANLDVVGVIRLTNTANSANYGTISDGGGLVINSQNNNPMYFYTGGSERMRIDGSGNVLVGASQTASSGLGVITGKNITFTEGNTTTSYVNIFRQSSSAAGILANGYRYSGTADKMQSSLSSSWAKSAVGVYSGYIGFFTDAASADTIGTDLTPTERMRIDSSGNLLVGKTSANSDTAGFEANASGFTAATRSNGTVFVMDRLTSDGEILSLRKDNSTVGSIACRSSGGNLQIHTNQSGIDFGGDGYLPMRGSSITDNSLDIGSSSFRYQDIYATNGTIQTSDRNEKQDIAELSDAEQRVAVAAKGLMRKFRWKSAVAEKGEAARTHFGIIAQDLQAAFAAESLDAGDYGMFISSTWTDEETGEERTRMGVRYSELLAFIIAAI